MVQYKLVTSDGHFTQFPRAFWLKLLWKKLSLNSRLGLPDIFELKSFEFELKKERKVSFWVNMNKVQGALIEDYKAHSSKLEVESLR